VETTAKQAREEYAAVVDQWGGRAEQAVGTVRPVSGQSDARRHHRTRPDRRRLDQWCLRHLDENSGARHNARHNSIEDRMVSANLPPVTEINSLTRTAAYLAQRGTESTEAERKAYETRKKAMLTKHSQDTG
jgi:hypothetical protein